MKTRSTKYKYIAKLRFLLAVLVSSPAIIYIYTPFTIILTILGIAAPFVTGRFIDTLIKGDAPWFSFGLLSGILLTKAAMTPLLQQFILSRSRRIELELQQRTLQSIINRSPSELSLLPNGELVAKLTRDTFAIGSFISCLYPRILVAIVTMISAGIALYSRSPTLALSFVIFIPFSIFLFIPFARRFSTNSHSVRQKSDKSFTILFDFLNSILFLRTLNAVKRFTDQPNNAMRTLKESNCKTDRLSIIFGSLLAAVLVIGEISVLAIAGAFASRGEIPVGDVVAYQMLFLVAIQSIQGIVSLLPEASTLIEAINSLNEILAYSPRNNGSKTIKSIKSIEFRNTTFAYPNGNSVINNFSTTLRAGTSTAIIGANGSGKTTLLKLAIGAIEPQQGEILINDLPISLLDEETFRNSIGIVFQESLLITGTIRDNITLKDTSYNDNDIALALKASGFDAVISRLPDGLETQVGLWGQALSGGELQRLAIARALIRNPSILVLDEVTNHLDAKTRKNFANLLKTITLNRIVLLVTHDEELANSCDNKIFCQN
ncbi:MAG: ABC transporter ATP-binding protein [Kiritimatiellae bacterium]|nr:ABC transporter ATP-binding protein [Kiritimatiellia bacterium]